MKEIMLKCGGMWGLFAVSLIEIMSQTERYDIEEDRANDIKTPDNRHHCSKHCHEKREANADALQELNDWYLRNSDTQIGEYIYQHMVRRSSVDDAPKPLTVSDYVDEGDFE